MKNKQFQQARQLGRLNFFCLGISSLIGWNSILTSLDYFAEQYPDQDAFFLLPLPFFIATNIFSILIYKISKYISMNFRIVGVQIINAIFILILPVQSYYIKGQLGFNLCILNIFLIGSANCMVQSTSVAFASIFPLDNYINDFFTGTGLAGVIIGLTRALFLVVIDEKNKIIGVLLYFFFSSAFLILSGQLHLIFRKSKLSKYYLKVSRDKTLTSEDRDWITGMLLDIHNQKESLSNKSDDSLDEIINPMNAEAPLTQSPNQKDIKYIFKVFTKILPMPICILINYIQTFMMFPGLALKKKFYQWDSLNGSWGPLLIVLCFNICDTLGKLSLGFFPKGIKLSTFVVLARYLHSIFVSRFLFFYSFIMIAQKEDNFLKQNDWIAILNVGLLGFTNGYCTNAHMSLGPDQADDHEKETVGYLMSFPLYLGIFLGILLALCFSNVGN